jgi:4a-hydroxytetrahydrobiopterin dehydratase
MDELAQLHCLPIDANTSRLDEHEINQLKEQLSGWRIFEKEGELRLEKLFKFENFAQAIVFTDRVAREANSEDHHPALLTEWGKVTVTWWTHKIKGLHKNDFIMAAKTDRLF